MVNFKSLFFLVSVIFHLFSLTILADAGDSTKVEDLEDAK